MRIRLIIIFAFFAFASFAVQEPKNQLLSQEIAAQLGGDDFQFRISSSTYASNGVQVMYGVQLYNQREIHGAYFNAAIKDEKLLFLHQSFILNPEKYVTTAQLHTPESLFTGFLQDFHLNLAHWEQINAVQYRYTDASLSDEAVNVYLKWEFKDKQLIPVVEISLYDKDHQHWYNTRINQENGAILGQDDWVVSCSAQHHNHASMRSPGTTAEPSITANQAIHLTHSNAQYEVFAWPVESPNHGARTVVVDPQDSVASPYGWHDVNGIVGAEYTFTRGNNVFASEDKDADNSPGTYPSGGSSLHFNSQFDGSMDAILYTDAAITNLFYWNNMMHDVWYNYGFDEQSGNFQQKNYSNQGSGSDYVVADAQDGSGTNNANFATPPDGGNPRMQMYIWNSGASTSYYMQVNSPSTAQGKYLASIAAFGPQLTSTPISGDLVITDPKRACTSISNNSEVSGKIAFIERGTCLFVDKVREAQAAGAIAAVLYDSTNSDPIYMGGTASDITIPVVMIKRLDGLFIRNLIPNGVNVSLYDSGSVGSTVFDSDFDAAIISHEYGHGISNRLTGGASNASCLQNQEQMGEGWSDFFGLVMTHEANDQGPDSRGVGTYVTNQTTDGGGIRPYPYSTDLNISPYTYNDITTFSVPHGVGSVWCAMLWDLYWAMIDEYGYDSDIFHGTGGNNMAMQLVMDGLKYQPCGPGFVDGRDAILFADQVNYNGANQKRIWEVFARRGLGYYADQGSSGSRADGVSSFEIPPIYKDALYIEKRAALTVQNDSMLQYTLVAKNYSGKTIYNITLSDTLPGGVKLEADDLQCNATFENNIVKIQLDSMVNLDSLICSFMVKVRFSETTSVLFFDDVESGVGNWQVVKTLNNNAWNIASIRKKSGNFAWYVDDVITQSDQSLVHSFTVTGSQPNLSFYHYYNTEASWDGGVVEINDNGTWVDAEPYFILNGYNSTINTNQASAISDRKAFSGNAGKWLNTKIDLSEFIGETIEIRFRFASDAAEGGDGWYLDDIQLEDATQIVNYLHAAYDQTKTSRIGAITFVEGEGLVLGMDNKVEVDGISIYPNPSSAQILVSWEAVDQYSMSLYDLSGKLILVQNGSKLSTLDLSKLAASVYTLELQSGNRLLRRKIVKSN